VGRCFQGSLSRPRPFALLSCWKWGSCCKGGKPQTALVLPPLAPHLGRGTAREGGCGQGRVQGGKAGRQAGGGCARSRAAQPGTRANQGLQLSSTHCGEAGRHPAVAPPPLHPPVDGLLPAHGGKGMARASVGAQHSTRAQAQLQQAAAGTRRRGMLGFLGGQGGCMGDGRRTHLWLSWLYFSTPSV